MNITKIEKKENNIVELNLEIEAEHAAQEYNKACRKLGQQVAIPGFRRGKAPRAVIEKYVGPEKIKREALDRLLPHVFADALSEQEFDVASEPIVESFTYELGSPLSVQVRLELKPEVKLPDYKGITVDVVKFEMPEDSLDQELKSLAEKYATLEPIIDRKTNEDDIVIIDYSGSINGEIIRGGSAKNHQLDLASNNFLQEFSEQLVNRSLGEEFVIHVTFPEDYYDPNLSGKKAEFSVKVNEIKEKKIPELNDDFAKKVSKFSTLEELKKDIEEYLKKSEEQENESRLHRAILEKIVEEAEVEIPDSMINKEARILLEEVQQRLKSQNISWEEVLDSQGHEKIWANLRSEALKRVKTSLVISAIIKSENIELTDQDFSTRVEELARAYNTDQKSVIKHIASTQGMVQHLSQQIISNKVLETLAGYVELNYVEEKPEEEEQSE
jgi:trigger factor